jgi:hypothetical protein
MALVELPMKRVGRRLGEMQDETAACFDAWWARVMGPQ